jgi:methylmalonyl-CoA mutase C-terminal domain/subunit
MSRKIRILVAKPGLDGHDRGAKVMAAAFRDAGMEVIYAGLRQTPEMIVEASIQEDVDVIALSILSGAHMTIFPAVLKLMKDNGLSDVLLTGGGIIPREEMAKLESMGVGKLFGPGTPTSVPIQYIRTWVEENRGVETSVGKIA